ncbi:MAG: DUF169 domain-containing protein [Planctomycetota bacterium]|nr:DUF169 domain-containing protein [Planctomycetota bacterium]
MTSKTSLNPASLNEAIERHIRPNTFPLGIKMVAREEDIPEKAKRPGRDMHFDSALCQGMGIARHYGWTIAVSRKDISCPIGATLFGFQPKVEHFTGGHCCAGMYTRDAAAGSKTEAAAPCFDFGQYFAMVSGPLNRIDFEPDVVLVFGNPAQVMRLVTGALWESGGYIHSRFSGRTDCADEVIETMKTGKPQVILPCYGDRIFAQTQDHEMAFSFPYGFGQTLVDGLEGTHKGGVRYPIPNYLRYTGSFPPSYEELRKYWPE